jgi:hypothetical protein
MVDGPSTRGVELVRVPNPTLAMGHDSAGLAVVETLPGQRLSERRVGGSLRSRSSRPPHAVSDKKRTPEPGDRTAV